MIKDVYRCVTNLARLPLPWLTDQRELVESVFRLHLLEYR